MDFQDDLKTNFIAVEATLQDNSFSILSPFAV